MLDNCQPGMLMHDDEFSDMAEKLAVRETELNQRDIHLHRIGQESFNSTELEQKQKQKQKQKFSNVTCSSSTRLERRGDQRVQY